MRGHITTHHSTIYFWTGLRRYDVADQLLARTRRPHHDRGALHPRDTGKSSLDLTRFNTKTTDLHLVVRAAHILQLALAVPPHYVTRPVHPRARRAERRSNKPRRRQPHAFQVAQADTMTCHIQLSDYSYRHAAETGIQYEEGKVSKRTAHGTDMAVEVRRNDPPERCVDGGLCGAVHVDQVRPGIQLI